MTTSKLLTLDEVGEIERRARVLPMGWIVPEKDKAEHWRHIYCRIELTAAPEFRIQVTPTTVGDIPVAQFVAHANIDIDALCATVRELAKNLELKTAQFNDAMAIYESAREQLAAVVQERDVRVVELEREGREMQKWNSRANQLAIEGQALRDQLAQVTQERDGLRVDNACGQCGGPHPFDTSVPSVVWNQVIRARGLSDYLCATCVVREFVRVRQGFTAQLWSEELNGVNIEVVVEGSTAQDAALVQEENNSLRNQLTALRDELNGSAEAIVNEAGKVGQLMDLASASAVNNFRTKAINLCREKAAEWEGREDPLGAVEANAARVIANELETL